MTIRKLLPTDKDQLLGLFLSFYKNYLRGTIIRPELIPFEEYKNTESYLQKAAEDYLVDPSMITLVAEENNQLIGYISGSIKEHPERVLDKEGYIEDWFVEEKYRQRGIGQKLFEELLSEFKSLGCNQVGTDTYLDNKDALALYHQLGFIDRLIVLKRKI